MMNTMLVHVALGYRNSSDNLQGSEESSGGLRLHGTVYALSKTFHYCSRMIRISLILDYHSRQYSHEWFNPRSMSYFEAPEGIVVGSREGWNIELASASPAINLAECVPELTLIDGLLVAQREYRLSLAHRYVIQTCAGYV